MTPHADIRFWVLTGGASLSAMALTLFLPSFVWVPGGAYTQCLFSVASGYAFARLFVERRPGIPITRRAALSFVSWWAWLGVFALIAHSAWESLGLQKMLTLALLLVFWAAFLYALYCLVVSEILAPAWGLLKACLRR